jgi:hypothetical protein
MTLPLHSGPVRLALIRIALLVVMLALGVAAVLRPLPAAPTAPSVAESQAVLGQLVALARSGDFERLCALADGNCRRLLEQAGSDRVPPTPPKVTSTRVIAPDAGTGALGGLVLSVCGTDAYGADYRSEVLVFRDGPGLRAINGVYWDGVTIAAGSTTISRPPSSPGPCR